MFNSHFNTDMWLNMLCLAQLKSICFWGTEERLMFSEQNLTRN